MAILLVILAYLSGSLPFGWIFVKLLTGKDIRKIGSGATGGTNVSRHAGLTAAILVGICDVLKAFIPTRLAVRRQPNNHLLHLACVGAAMLGHSRSLFLGFRGGKAVSSAAGTLFAIAAREPNLWRVCHFATGVFFGAIVGSGGKVSVGSMTGSVAGGIYALRLARQRKMSIWYASGVAAAAAYICLMHKENIARILRGEEPNTGREMLGKLANQIVALLGRKSR